MKEYFGSILLFVGLLVVLFRLANDQHKAFKLEEASMEDARLKAQIASQTLQMKSLQLSSMLGRQTVEGFRAQYDTTLRTMREVSSIAQVINRQAELLRMPPQEQRTRSRSIAVAEEFNIGNVEANEYTISVLGSFRDSLIWLGQVEDTFPLARTEYVQFSPSGNLVSLNITMVFPRIDPTRL